MTAGTDLCTGCGACQSICPVNCINMLYDSEGFLFPEADGKRCIDCKKCEEVCPVLKERKGYHAGDCSFNLAADYEAQKESASGGVFYLLVKQWIEIGGYVAGAVWDEDLTVRHIVSNKTLDLERMRKSKYIQSNVKNVYKEIKDLLDAQKKVLFSGTPCQTAGLKSYLQKEYSNLFLVDIICHGVASTSLLKKHVRDLTDEKILQIDFRNREKLGTGIGLYLRCDSGKEIKKRGIFEDSFVYEYCLGTIYRKSCYACKFRNNYMGDILIGDAGQIHYDSFEKEMMERSIVFPLTSKGREAILQNLSLFRYIGHSTFDEVVAGYNGSLVRSEIHNRLLRDQLYSSIYGEGGCKKHAHFDVLLVVLWGQSYGNHLVNYALYKAIERMGKSVVALCHTGKEIPEYVGGFLPEKNRGILAANMELSYRYMETNDMRDIADTVVVGSDILWNKEMMSDYGTYRIYSLAFFEKMKKISYGTSMGTREGFPIDRLQLFKDDIKEYQAVSVRERWAVEWLANKLNVEADVVVDPVFLLDKEEYIELCREVEMNESSQVLMYFLYMDESHAEFVRLCENKLHLKVTVIVDWGRLENRTVEFSTYGLDDKLTKVLDISEWLWYFRNAEYIVTDSWHGACFATIFEKKFLALPTRMTDRFETLTGIAELENRFVDFENEKDWERYIDLLKEDINYDKVQCSMREHIEFSKRWLRSALKA